MRADELNRRFALIPHVEGGAFLELDEALPEGSPRAASGVIYYYLGPDEHSDFHVLDSDEYWLWHAGSSIEVWIIEDGKCVVKRLGVEPGSEPCILLKGGTVFGARHIPGECADGCFVSCVTVPRFSYESYRIIPKEEMLETYPDSAAFFNF